MKWTKLKNNIPHKFKVKRSDYETVFIKDLDNGKTVGEARLDHKLIILVQNQTPKELVSTFFHEFIHVLSEEYDANLTEKQVLALEKSLPDIIKLIGELTSEK